MPDSWIICSLVVVISSILVGIFALWIVRKFIPTELLKEHHDVAGFTFSIVGVLYSVILGFTVINVKERYNIAQETIHTEATMIADLSRNADVFPEEKRDEIRKNLRAYIAYVTAEEWGKEGIHLKAQVVLQNIWNSYYSIDIADEKTRIWYELSISKLDKLLEARLKREYNSWQRLSPMMWCLLIAGAIVTASFMFFFGLENFQAQTLMMVLLVGYMSFMLFLIYVLDNVFKAPEGIKPIAFEKILPLVGDAFR